MKALPRGRRSLTLAAVAAVALGIALPTTLVATAASTVTGPSGSIAASATGAVPVPGFAISGTTEPSVTVQIASQTGTLALASTSGLVVDPASTGTRLVVRGSETDLNAALDGLTYTRVGVAADAITVSAAGENQYICAATGNVYQVVDGPVDWFSAMTGSAAAFGGNGYLATVTSDAENECIFAGVADATGDGRNAWLAGRLVTASVLDWQWDAGPEQGDILWEGGVNGAEPAGVYTAFDRSAGGPPQPQSTSGQGCLQYYNADASLATWHDNGCGAANKYVAEVPFEFATLASDSVDVLAAPAAASAALPSTGADLALPMGIAVAVLLTGTALVIWRGRRNLDRTGR